VRVAKAVDEAVCLFVVEQAVPFQMSLLRVAERVAVWSFSIVTVAMNGA
jgi:hypothetical protein